MALAHQIHRHSRNEDHDDDHYAGPDMAGVEVIAAGSVTSFVRKLFQMVQGECDSVVGFVAGAYFFTTLAVGVVCVLYERMMIDRYYKN